MNRFERRVTLRVLAIHAAVVLFLVLQSMLQGCFRPKPREEIVTFIEFGSPAPPAQVQVREQVDDPPPVQQDPPPVQQDPPPQEPRVPEPEIPEPIPVEPAPKQVVKEPEPKWEPTPVVPQLNNKTEPTPPKPKIDIGQAFEGIVETPAPPTPTPAAPRTDFSSYDSQIYATFYNAWKQPPANASRPAKVTISIDSSGRVTSCRLSQSSQDAAYDKTVMDAARSVSRLPVPPAGYPLSGIVINFVIDS